MAITYNFLKNVILDIKQETSQNPTFVCVLLVLLSIPLPYAINSISLVLLVLSVFFGYKKEHFKSQRALLLPIILYAIMLLSILWTIDFKETVTALSKELPVLLIPLVFLIAKDFTKIQKDKILKYYSFGIVLYCLFYLTKAIIRFAVSETTDVFFYHELVTKDVNAIHVSVYVAVAFFYFFTRINKTILEYGALLLLLLMVFLLSSKNIIVVFIGLIVIHYVFYSKVSRRMRLRNLVLVVLLIGSLGFIGKVKERILFEYQSNMADSTVNDVISKGDEKVYNVSIRQAWNNEQFNKNDFFPGTAFRVYQFRIFLELMSEDNKWLTGYGLNASYSKIEEKALKYNLYLGDEINEGYQKKNFHNQYIQVFAEIGVLGFIILIMILAYSLKIAIKSKDFVQISFTILMISLFLTESFLWRQRGVVFFATMYCLFNANSILMNQTNDANQ